MEVKTANTGAPLCFSDFLPSLEPSQCRQSHSPRTTKAPKHPSPQGGAWPGGKVVC